MATVIGDDYGNTLYGTGGADVIKGFGGDDTLKGFGGADHIDGGTGIDAVFYGDSTTGVLVNLVQGRGYYGTAEGDRLFSIENVYGSAYRDVLIGNGGANRLFGLGGDDFLEGGGGNDILDGSDGQDDLMGGAGADVLIGGTGPDMANYSQSFGGVWVSLADNVGMNNDAQGDTFSSIENIAGSTYDDTLIGDNGANLIFAGFGADVLFGLDGADILDGYRGADTMFGGAGDDTYLVYDATDVVVESGGQGADRVITTVSYFLPSGADVETLIAASGFDAINLIGNASGNEIIGNFGANVINGGGGRDYLTGGFGEDSFRFDTSLDARFNVDVITDFNVADDTILLQDTVFSAFALGPVDADRFVLGTAALDANDNLLYDASTGALYYDSDGNGGTAAIQFATLSRGLALTHVDFDVI